MDKQLKVCLAASAGGHLIQLLRLSASWQQQKTFFISTLPAVSRQLNQLGKTYIIGDANRRHPIGLLKVLWRCYNVIRHERPDVVISTGAAPGLFACILGKLFGAKIIWIDSIANTRNLSLSGRIIRPFCDKCLTQWKHLRSQKNNIDYYGSTI